VRKPVQSQASSHAGQEESRIAGVKNRPKSGERNINDIFGAPSQGQAFASKIESRSLQTYDINGVDQNRNYQGNIAAGVRNGSPTRKNESSVFSHLQSDATDRE
jgi:hypothetical protein